MKLSATTRLYLRLIAMGFALGVIFQLGIGAASHFAPRVAEIRIITSQGAEAPDRASD